MICSRRAVWVITSSIQRSAKFHFFSHFHVLHFQVALTNRQQRDSTSTAIQGDDNSEFDIVEMDADNDGNGVIRIGYVRPPRMGRTPNNTETAGHNDNDDLR